MLGRAERSQFRATAIAVATLFPCARISWPEMSEQNFWYRKRSRSRIKQDLRLWRLEPYRFAPRKTPSSSGMLKRGSRFAVQLLHPHFASVVSFERTACNKTALVHGEHKCAKEVLVALVKRNVDEHALSRPCHANLG